MAAPPRGVTEAVISGWPGLRLTTDALSVTVLPGKGADICELTDLATGVDPLFRAPWGLQPPGAPPARAATARRSWRTTRETWQELFPNTNDACRHGARGAAVPRRGGRAALVGVPSRPTTSARSRSACRSSAASSRCGWSGSCGCATAPASWCSTSGSPTCRGGASRSPGGTTACSARRWSRPAELRRAGRHDHHAPPQPWEDTARLVPGQRSAWPMARLRGRRGRPVPPAGSGGGQPRRRLPDRPGRRCPGRQPGPRPGLPAGLGPGGVPVDHRVAAVRRGQGDAAARLVRPRRRAVDGRGDPGAGGG